MHVCLADDRDQARVVAPLVFAVAAESRLRKKVALRVDLLPRYGFPLVAVGEVSTELVGDGGVA
jgi:hypothetical protein